MKLSNPFFKLLLLGFLLSYQNVFGQVKVGNNAASIDPSAILELEATNKGLLIPRLTSFQRDAISNPAAGLIIYNTETRCFNFFVGPDWFESCGIKTLPPAPVLGANFTNGFQNNLTCSNSMISITPCSYAVGASINDNVATVDGIEYDWANATNVTLGTGFGAPSNTQALVEIGGQCWARFNANVVPATGSSWCYNNNAAICATDGRLYNWSATLNGATTERAQGVCPTGWHIPSDCEWMYLENSLGMSTSDQQQGSVTWRSTGSVGSKLSTFTSGGNNNSGFTALFTGQRSTSGTFQNRNFDVNFWTSLQITATTAHSRAMNSNQVGVLRYVPNKDHGFSVRCLKD